MIKIVAVHPMLVERTALYVWFYLLNVAAAAAVGIISHSFSWWK